MRLSNTFTISIRSVSVVLIPSVAHVLSGLFIASVQPFMSADTATAAASAAADDLDIVIAHTLQLLQRRLRRIEFLITGGLTHDSTDRNDNGSGDDSSDGDNDDSGTKIKMDKNKNKKLKKQSVKQGLRSINASLQNLSARSAGVRQILELREFLLLKLDIYMGHRRRNVDDALAARARIQKRNV